MRTPLKVERVGAVAELTAGLKREKRSVNQIRLRAVLAVAKNEHVPAVARALSVGERAVRNWVHAYNASGLEGLSDQRAGRVCRLSAEDQARLRERIRSGSLETDGVCSLRGQDIRRILEEEFGVAYAESGVYYLLHHQLGFSYLKPRPLHRKTDPAAQEAFKKSSRKRSKTSGGSIPRNGSRSGSRMKAASGSKGR
jgi:transposase